MRNAVAVGVHASELPQRQRVALRCGVFERLRRAALFPAL